MQVIVSLIVGIPASADINQIEECVQAADQQAMRAAEEQSEGTDRRVVLALRRMGCQGCQQSLWAGNVAAARRLACI